MTVGNTRSLFAVFVCLSHVLFVFVAAFFLAGRITKFETYLSTLSVFLPVFGVYVGIVVKNIRLTVEVQNATVSVSFLAVTGILFFAYLGGNLGILLAYGSGLIRSEDLLPGAFGVVEAAFGGFVTSLFLLLFDDEATDPTAK